MIDPEDIERSAIQEESAPQRRGRKRASPPQGVPANDPDERPAIRLVTGDLHGAIEQGIDALRADPDLYQRETTLVHVTHVTAEEEAGSHGECREGTPQIHVMSVNTLRERLTRHARWFRFNARSENWLPAEPPDHVVRGIADRKAWPRLRRLTGIIEAPSLRPDGSVIDQPGYDAATGYLYIPSCDYPAITERPTLEDARQALAVLEDVFVDFPYSTPAGSSVAVAAALTLIARPAIKGAVPAFIYDANTPGSGKSLQADSISMLAYGRVAGRKDFPTDRRSANDEISKVLCAYAIVGTRLVNFDNLGHDIAFGGPALEMVLTAEHTAEFRVLGSNTLTTLPWRTVIFGSGNNVTIARDMLRRCMVSRIESPYERPELRPLSDFKHPERAFALKAWIKDHRVELVAAALTLLRAHAVAGRPSPGRTWGSFEAWTRVIADAIVWAGGEDPLACRPDEAGETDPERRALAVVLRHWGRLDPDGHGLTLKTAMAALYPPERLRGDQLPPDGFEEMREAIEQITPAKPRQAPDAVAFGNVLRRYKRSVVGGLRFETVSGRAGVVRWLVKRPGAKSAPDTAIGDPADV
jgi:putative DNA primase/helicase